MIKAKKVFTLYQQWKAFIIFTNYIMTSFHSACVLLQPVGRYVRLASTASPILSLNKDNVRIYGHIAEETDGDGDGLYFEDCGNALQGTHATIMSWHTTLLVTVN